MKYTIQAFDYQFADNDACLEYLFHYRYGAEYICIKCQRKYSFSRVKNRKTYACICGFQVYPTSGTIFHNSSTSLKSWFYAIFLMSQCKNGVSAKEIERHVGVSYTTALRMTRQIRLLMGQSPMKLEGTVEADETYIGGENKNKHAEKKTQGSQGRNTKDKIAVFGVVQRKGRVKAKVVINVKRTTVMPIIRSSVTIGTDLMTDEFNIYKSAQKEGYRHDYVTHSQKQYVRGDVHTNTIEGFWSQLKRSIDGTFHSVSPKYLQLYVDEFAFRYNYRLLDQHLFQTLLERL